MKCPKCESEFEEVEFGRMTVHRCVGCRGIWFDRTKHEYLKTVEGSEEIDSGDPAVGRRYNEQGALNCPECFGVMIRMVDPDQPHIWYEACSRCFGVFFDAGEFRDYKEKTVLDFVRDLFTTERP